MDGNDERLDKIDELCGQLVRDSVQFTPVYPYVFVLVCTKAQKVGAIYTPDKQNKPVHEGIVLATWKSRVVERRVLSSALNVGDRVLFPHSAGLPVSGFDTDRFRVVRERDWELAEHGGGILCTVDLSGGAPPPFDKLISLVADDVPLAEIERRFVVVERHTQSVTLSGV